MSKRGKNLPIKIEPQQNIPSGAIAGRIIQKEAVKSTKFFDTLSKFVGLIITSDKEELPKPCIHLGEFDIPVVNDLFFIGIYLKGIPLIGQIGVSIGLK